MTEDLSDLKTNFDYKPNTPKLLNQVQGRPVKPKTSGIQLKLAKSARKGISRQVSYTKKNGEFAVYQVQRYSFRNNKGVRYFYRWDLHDNQIKSFIVANISNVAELQVPHKRLWIIEMGNDPQQQKYWLEQKKKSQQQRDAQKIAKQAKEKGKKVKQQVEDDEDLKNIYKDAQKRDKVFDARKMDMDLSDAYKDLDKRNKVFKKRQAQVDPVVKTIRRSSSNLRGPKSPTGPNSTIKPFGTV